MAKKITVRDFCDLQGLSQPNRFVLLKREKATELKPYEEWYAKYSYLGIGDMKNIQLPEVSEVEGSYLEGDSAIKADEKRTKKTRSAQE